MNKKIVKSSLIALALAGGSLMATDFHAPLPGGPLRYDFEKIQKNKSAFNFWSTGYIREADKAYMKHGFDTKPFTTLIFGKDKFKLAEAFQNATDDVGYTKNRNPYLNTTYFAPRASYSERGIVLGAQWAYPVWANKGRIGIRGSLPLRNVRVEKDDEMEHSAVGAQDKVIKGEARLIPAAQLGADPGANSDKVVNGILGAAGAAGAGRLGRHDGAAAGAAGAGAPIVLSGISSYNLKFLAGVKTLTVDGRVTGLFSTADDGTQPMIAGYRFPRAAEAPLAGNNGAATFAPFIVIKQARAGELPFGQGGALLYNTNVNAGGAAAVGTVYALARGANTRIVYVDKDNNIKVTGMPTGGAGAMAAAPTNWTAGGGEGQALVLAHDLAYPINDAAHHIPEDLWVTTIHGNNGRLLNDTVDAVTFIDNALEFYKVGIPTFLSDRGYAFQTYQLTGLGDTDLDLFYNHSFSDRWNGELYAGVKIPTGAGDKYYGNPYKTLLGNGDHFEIKVGGKVAWDTCKWLNVKADAHYNFVLEATEHRMAAFQGATIKNLGPKADADVSWGYFTGDIDFTLFHPKTRDIATTFGYELYYKTEDRISYKQKTMTDHWLGQVWAQNGSSMPANATTAGNHWADLPWTLDNKVARKNTESIGHRAYVEGSYQFSKYLNMTVGGKYTFAGQNIPCEGEAYTGFNVKF